MRDNQAEAFTLAATLHEQANVTPGCNIDELTETKLTQWCDSEELVSVRITPVALETARPEEANVQIDEIDLLEGFNRTRRHTPSVAAARKEALPVNRFMQISHQNGVIYNTILDILLSKDNPEVKRKKVKTLISRLKSSLPRLAKGQAESYNKSLEHVDEKLNANRALLKEPKFSILVNKHSGDLSLAILESRMIRLDLSTHNISIILSSISQKVRFIEVYPGLIFLEADEEAMEVMRKYNVIPENAAAVHINRLGQFSVYMRDEKPIQPEFLLFPGEAGISELKLKRFLRHELSHFIHTLVSGSEADRKSIYSALYIRRSDLSHRRYRNPTGKPDFGLAQVFNLFRDELSAFIVEGPNFDQIELDWLIHLEQNIFPIDHTDAYQRAGEALNFARVVRKILETKGIDKSVLIYPTLAAVSFEDFKKQYARLADFDGNILGILERILHENPELSHAIKELIALKNDNQKRDVGITVSLGELLARVVEVSDSFRRASEILMSLQREETKPESLLRGVSQESLNLLALKLAYSHNPTQIVITHLNESENRVITREDARRIVTLYQGSIVHYPFIETADTRTLPSFMPKAKTELPVELKDNHNLGGIDFCSLPIVSTAIQNLSFNGNNGALNRLSDINLSQEWQQIESLVNAGIIPSPERIKEYVWAASIQNKTDDDFDRVILCIADILRKDEEDYLLTNSTLRDILIVLTTGLSTTELRSIFTSAKVN
jgi:hypothetical protein